MSNINIDEELDPSPEYVKGFNLGYQCGRNEPETFKQILGYAVEQGGDYLQGVKHGKTQYDRERTVEQLKISQQSGKSKNLDRGR